MRPTTPEDMRLDFKHAMDTGALTLILNDRHYVLERRDPNAVIVFDSGQQAIVLTGWNIHLEPSLDERTWLERMLHKSRS